MPASPIVSTPAEPAPVAVAVEKVVTVILFAPPPLLSKTKPARVLSPKRFNALPPPFKVTRFVAAICPATVLLAPPMVTVPRLMTRPRAGTAAAGIVTPEALASRLRVPPLRTVPPV